MKGVKKSLCFIIACMVCVHFFSHAAFAAETTGGWRPVFDLVMRWANFIIIVFILVKYTRTPIKDFFLSRRNELASEIQEIEGKKEEAEKKIHEALKLMEESEVRLIKIREQIINNGEMKKQQIIEDAQQESKLLLEGAKRRIENQFREAKQTFQSELVEMAIRLATERLPNEITAEDHWKFINQFLARTSAK